MDAYLYAAVRTPFGRYRGGLSGIRTDDLAALPIRELLARVPGLDPAQIDDVYLGNTNGAGEENATWPGWPLCSLGCRRACRA